jgi:hypothetical protein
MPVTYDLISSTTLGSASNTITLELPSTYTDIQIKASLRSDRAANGSNAYFYLNNDTSSGNYSRAIMYDEDGALGTEVVLFGVGGTARQFAAVMAASTPANTFSSVTVDLINYQSSIAKTFSIWCSGQRQGGATRIIWRNTHGYNQTTPVTQFSFVDVNGNFIAGSTVSIYGIKKA